LISKSTALIIGLILIALFGIVAFMKATDAVILSPILTAIVALVSAYIGLQVANNGVMGKFFNPDLRDAENSERGKE